MITLPIDDVLPRLRDALAGSVCAVVQAPPGAGKTTRIPLALLDEPWLAGGRIVMMEPRRLAARAAAGHMAHLLGERVGETVGYRMRLDTNVGPATRIEVVTEGVLARMLQNDPGLEGVGVLIFDEFHERSLNADLGLVLALESQRELRPDLRVLVMSATLDGQAVAALLGNAPIITSEGRAFPVDVHYLERSTEERIEHITAPAVRRTLKEQEGDVLVFLPGAAEIRRTATLLRESDLPGNVLVMELYGMLGQAEQDAAISPARAGTRKVVLATSIAETSLTIEGIRTVIDSGYSRVPRFSPRSGMARLETVRVTKASADQRCGRAGRLGPGTCLRLWSRHDHITLLDHNRPEILDADLTSLALELAEWGVQSPNDLQWLDAPPAAAFAQARELLAWLGALDPEGRITPHGRRIAALPLHPRLAHMMLVAAELKLGATACALAALLGERDIFRSTSRTPDIDLRLRLATMRAAEGDRDTERTSGHGGEVDRAGLTRAVTQAREWRKRLRVQAGEGDVEACGLLVALAYPDRIAKMRTGQPGRYLLRSGAGAVIPEAQLLSGSPYLAIADLDGRKGESRVFLAAPITAEEIQRHFGEEIVREESVAWDDTSGAVRARALERLGAIVMRETQLAKPSPEAIAEALVRAIEEQGIAALPWSREARRMQQRMAFMRRFDPAWPDVSDEHLSAALREWLLPHITGMRRREDLNTLDIAAVLSGMLNWNERQRMDEEAPTHLVVPSGSRIPIEYDDPEAPTLSVRLQEMFGCAETPRIARGAVPLTIHLLSPAHRPVQVTRDLANFWRTTYFDVRKDLKGRYPKHHWPDDPMAATPTNKAKRRGL